MKALYFFSAYLLVYMSKSTTLPSIELQQKIIVTSLMVLGNLLIVQILTKNTIFSLKKDFFTICANLSILIYYPIVLFLQTFSTEEIRTILKSLIKSIEFEQVEKSYMDNCNSLSSVPDKIDVFIVAHLLGWFVKGFALRNFSLLTVNSILFELCELKFQHILPNFYECWWDHILLDILGCNLFGVLLSLLTLKWLKWPLYQWKFSNTTKRRTSNIYFDFFDKMCRNLFHNSSTLLLLIFCSIMMNLIDLNVFFLKAMLHLSTTNPLVVARTLLWGFIAMKACIELNKALTKKASTENFIYLGAAVLILLLETALCIKWRSSLKSDNSDNTLINLIWSLIATTFGSIWLLLYINETPTNNIKKKRKNIECQTYFERFTLPLRSARQFLMIKRHIGKKTVKVL